ncbi:UTP--GlnB (protein PII) uridylyltransferase, GlnD [Desulfocicer vacuolatum DSM 3385]|uniref:Bifunctional uridylyltransferase/uridylyl-removing enzyme n=1 Tax=Desulfocicer vacuolatum DSM 3385 TaxID=1121400 RepID=A0A1W1ZRL4_9BACT|nr:[protein-PII] uridylyltransferase [Desulfocicer vacuolatum]SMC51175.1 UTP--GlnB (protein PII) uridylyltransferase, GlnD [Desulfocicer vacuolatum DSM 3385]
MKNETDAGILIQKRDQLIKNFLRNKEPRFLESFAVILDEYFQSALGKSNAAADMTFQGNPVALVALGGYGRQEQCVHSDVDLLLLFENNIPRETEQLIKDLLYPLWDIHLETGYAVRTVKDCLDMAWQQFDILTTMLDARFICGASPIFFMLREQFRRTLSSQHQEKSLTRLVENGRKRHRDFGDSTYLIEPNLKSGHGGLRDYHTLLWYARIKENIRCRRDLERNGFLSHEEYEALEEALTFIWSIRNRLHYITGRKCDQLHFEHQVEVAKLLGFKSRHRHQGVESFMGKLHAKMDFLKQTNQRVTETILLDKRGKRFSFPAKPTPTPGIQIQRRRLEFSSMKKIPQNPSLLLKIFVESGRSRTPLSIESRRIVGEFVHLVDDAFCKDPAHVKDFEKTLATSFWEFNVLNVMLATGLLVKIIPEFSRLVHKIQYNQYHLFPVDKHSIRCVQEINSLKKTKKNDPRTVFYNSIYKEVRNRRNLLMAALLHDIGKGEPNCEHSRKGSEITEKILQRFGYSPTDTEEICFLIEHHLFLIKVATRRDISDEETVILCANKINQVGRLRMLYLLTVADSRATGPKAWNEWTENLLKELFLKTMGILKKGELASRRAARIIQRKKADVMALKKASWDKESLARELSSMAHRYLLYVPPEEIIEHLDLHKKLGDNAFLWKVKKTEDADIRTIAICGKDTPGFFFKLAGVFFLNGLNIVGSQAYAWGNNTALDIFKVMPPRDRLFETEKWEKAEKDLHLAIADDCFLNRLKKKLPGTLTLSSGQAPIPNRVKIDNETSSFFTIIEVFTYDFPGLLFAITHTLFLQGLDVRIAMAATKVDQVVDVFYVKTLHGEKLIDPHGIESVKQAILDALPELIPEKETV